MLSCYRVACRCSALRVHPEGAGTRPAGPPRCRGHGRPCALRVVSKDGEDKGRRFFACPLPRGAQCAFFEVSVRCAQRAVVSCSARLFRCGK